MSTSAIITTPGAANANSYVSLSAADQYHDDRVQFDDVWKDAGHPAKTQSILYATKLIDRLLKWTGQPKTLTQALLWPRVGMYYRNGDYIPDDIIPLELQWATAEYAFQLLTVRGESVADATAKSQLEELAGSARKLGVHSVGTPTVNLTLEDGQSSSERVVQHVPREVLDLMPDYWFMAKGFMVELLRA